MKKVLVIKTGHTELLTNELSGGPSLGDVFRSTCILEEFSDSHVTWLTDESAASLLPAAPLVHEVIACNVINQIALCAREFDVVINLERCTSLASWYRTFLQAVNPAVVLGFHNSGADETDSSVTPNSANGTSSIDLQLDNNPDTRQPYQYYLFQLLGMSWSGQRYAIPAGVDSDVQPRTLIGFNHAVGPKWPVKAWPMSSWQDLAVLCEHTGYSYSYQEGFTDLNHYIRWIQDHTIIVSSDSLGIHLALALGKTVIGLFGPTRASDVHFYGQGEGLAAPSACGKQPCFAHSCDFSKHCMENIAPGAVFTALQKYAEPLRDKGYFFTPDVSANPEKRRQHR